MNLEKGDRVQIINDPYFAGATGKIDRVIPDKFRKLGIDYHVKFDSPVRLENGGVYDSMNFKESELIRK